MMGYNHFRFDVATSFIQKKGILYYIYIFGYIWKTKHTYIDQSHNEHYYNQQRTELCIFLNIRLRLVVMSIVMVYPIKMQDRWLMPHTLMLFISNNLINICSYCISCTLGNGTKSWTEVLGDIAFLCFYFALVRTRLWYIVTFIYALV